MDVRLPDGTVIRNVPEGITKSQLMAKVGKIPQPEKGFFDRVGEDMSRRGAAAEGVIEEYRKGNQSLPETYLQHFGQYAGLANDIAGEAFKSVGRGVSSITPDFIEKPVRQAGKNVFDTVANSPVGDLARSAVQEYQDFSQEYPRAAKNIESVANIGALVGTLTPVKGTSLAGAAVDAVGSGTKTVAKAASAPVKAGAKSVSEGAGNLWKGAFARTPEKLDEISSAMKAESSASYTKFRETGAIINKNRASNIINRMEKAMSDTGKLNARLHGDTLSVIEDMRKAQKSGAFSLEEFDQYRQLLSDVINKNTDGIKGPNPDAFKAIQAIDALDEAIDRLKPIDILGGDTAAVEALKQGRAQWAKYRKFQSVANIVRQSDGDPNRLKSALQRFVNKPKNLKGFTAEEKKAIIEAAKNSTAEKIFKAFGKFGFDLGSSLTPGNTALPALTGGVGLMGVPHAAPIVIGGTVSRQLQKYLGRGKAEKVLKIIQEGAGK